MDRRDMGTLEALAREQRPLAVWLCREYGALSFEDAEDLVAEALSRINGDLPSQLPAARAYLRRMLQRDAIDELRHRHGRRPSEKAQRPRVVSIEQLADGAEPAGSQTADGELAQRATRALSQAAVQRALASLPEQERETVRMRYLDGLEPEAICRGLGLSRTQYERRLTDGIRGALEALVADTPLDACHDVRAAIAASPGRLGDHDAARRDAHLEECLSCRAFERRARGLLGLLPTGPVLGWWAQLRLKGEAWLHRGAEAASGAPGGDATAAATAGGAGAAGGLSASGLLAGGAAVKLAAACSSAAVAVVCVAQVAPQREKPARSHPAAAVAKPSQQRPAAGDRVTVVPTVMATPAASAGPTFARRAASSRRSRTAGRRRTAVAARDGGASAEFGPEGAAADAASSATASAASAGSSAPSDTTSSAQPPARPQPVSESAGGEFEP